MIQAGMVLASEDYLLFSLPTSAGLGWTPHLLLQVMEPQTCLKEDFFVHIRKSPGISWVQTQMYSGARWCQHVSASLHPPSLLSLPLSSLWGRLFPWGDQDVFSFCPPSLRSQGEESTLLPDNTGKVLKLPVIGSLWITCFPWANHIGLRDAKLQVRTMHPLLESKWRVSLTWTTSTEEGEKTTPKALSAQIEHYLFATQ